jgi:uncharacterized protein
MIYIDANVFIFAYYHPKKRTLSPKTKWIKEQSKKIIQQLVQSNSDSAQYCISLIQISEITNFLKKSLPQKDLHEFLLGLYSNPNLEIVEVTNSDYLTAIEKMKELDIDANDICAYLVMKKKKIDQMYTFDEGFRTIKDIECLPPIPDKFDID